MFCCHFRELSSDLSLNSVCDAHSHLNPAHRLTTAQCPVAVVFGSIFTSSDNTAAVGWLHDLSKTRPNRFRRTLLLQEPARLSCPRNSGVMALLQ